MKVYCKHLLKKGDCGHPDLGSIHHACVMIKDMDECPKVKKVNEILEDED